jgi:hypothetical protein
MNEHLSYCDKMPINCPQECGEIITRDGILYHVQNMCGNTVVNCSYKRVGCHNTITKREMQDYLHANSHTHLALYTNFSLDKLDQIEALNGKVERLEAVIGELKEMLSQMVKPKSFTKKEVNENFLKTKRPREDCEIKIESTLYTSSHPEDFVLSKKSVKYIPQSKERETLLLMNTNLTENFQWRVTGSFSNKLGIGLCVKDLAMSNNFKFTPTSHASFLLSMDGYIWNSNVQTENNVKVSLPPRAEVNVLDMKYSKAENTLEFYLNGQSVAVLSEVFTHDNYSLAPTCVFREEGEEVQIELV